MKFDVDFFSFLSVFVPLLVGLFLYRRVLVTTKILIFFVAITAVLEIGVLVFYCLKWNNLFFFHIHTFVEFTLISWIFVRLTEKHWMKIAISSILPLFMLFSICTILFIENVVGFNSIQRHVEASIIILYVIMYIIETADYSGELWHEKPFLIFALGLLLYFAGSLFVFIFANEMFSTGKDTAWVIHGVLNIILNLVITFVIAKSIVYPKKNRINSFKKHLKSQ